MAVFNSDQYSHLALHKGNPCHDELVKICSEDVLDDNGDIDPKKMAAVIFSDEEKRLAVNGVVHPFVREGMHKFFDNHKDDAFVFAEVPLLFEAGWEVDFDEIVLVTCDQEIAIERMMSDRGYTREQALERCSRQIDPEIQKAKADRIIYNNGSLKDLDSEINAWMKEMRKEMRDGNQSA